MTIEAMRGGVAPHWVKHVEERGILDKPLLGSGESRQALTSSVSSQRLELPRRSINAFRQQRYVALSCTWTPSKHEDPKIGQYPVENWDDEDT
nr:uncharacterized protein CTRU02_05501 [Colletotrichum truncatum]KAF6793944.1 hypothetical protein CTRU02_05501 [Colletotrichum truncatum]